MKKLIMYEQIDFANYLRELRNAAGLSQGDVAKIMGYSSAQFISNWERGLSLPPVTALRQIAFIYKVPTEKLAENFMIFSLKKMEAELNAKLFDASNGNTGTAG
ncbi:MAG: XRE family transcriptional regulator [Proteobacteria bacterium]|nr:MAG: XRE family transcriptional regulator [Pseudomonadota bacterium]